MSKALVDAPSPLAGYGIRKFESAIGTDRLGCQESSRE
jgi:hypothetical protein